MYDGPVRKIHTVGRRFVCASLCGLALSAGGWTAERSETLPLSKYPELAARLQVLDAWIADRVETLDQPGLSIGVVYDGDLIWTRSYGYADLRKKVEAAPFTVYRIGSLSKAFTAIAVLQLHEAGKLRLSDPVRDHLPWFKPRNPFPEAETITIYHLLKHTSGLPFDAPGVNWNDYSLPRRKEVIERIGETEIVYPPGLTKYYSNFGYWIAGEVIRAVTGNPVETYVDKSILQPLGMTNTDLAPSPDMPHIAVGYGARLPGKNREQWRFTDTRFYTPAGDGASSVEDLARLVAFFMGKAPAGGREILKHDTLHLMWGDLKKDSEDAQDGEDVSRHRKKELRIYHGGDGGGFVGGYRVDVARRFGVVALTNADDGDPWSCLDQAFSIILPGIEKLLHETEKTPAPNPEWNMYLGTYSWRGDKAQIVAFGDKLFIADPDGKDPWDSKIELRAAGAHTYRMIEVPPGYGELLRFDVAADGTVAGIRFPSGYKAKD